MRYINLRLTLLIARCSRWITACSTASVAVLAAEDHDHITRRN